MPDSYTPPARVRRAAARALDLRASLPPSRRAMTPAGLARARDLSNGRPVSLDVIRRMSEFFTRNASSYRAGEGWGVDSKGWQAWLGWGGDPGRTWARAVLRSQSTSSTSKE